MSSVKQQQKVKQQIWWGTSKMPTQVIQKEIGFQTVQDENIVDDVRDLSKLLHQGVYKSGFSCKKMVLLLSHLHKFNKNKLMQIDNMIPKIQYWLNKYNDNIDRIAKLKLKYIRKWTPDFMSPCKRELNDVINVFKYNYNQILKESYFNPDLDTQSLRRYMDTLIFGNDFVHDNKLIHASIIRKYYDPLPLLRGTGYTRKFPILRQLPMPLPNMKSKIPVIDQKQNVQFLNKYYGPEKKIVQHPQQKQNQLPVQTQEVILQQQKQQKSQASQCRLSQAQQKKKQTPRYLADILKGEHNLKKVLTPQDTIKVKTLEKTNTQQQSQASQRRNSQGQQMRRRPTPGFLADLLKGKQNLKQVQIPQARDQNTINAKTLENMIKKLRPTQKIVKEKRNTFNFNQGLLAAAKKKANTKQANQIKVQQVQQDQWK